jgi:replication factor C subunit 1
LDEYSMSRDDLFETLGELQFPESPEFKNYFALIQSTAKAAFTREYNKRGHRSQILVGDEGVSKKSKKRGPALADDDGEEGDEIDGEEVEEEDEVDIEAFRAKPKKRAAPSATSSSSSKKKLK